MWDALGGAVSGGMDILGGYFSNQYNKKAAEVAFQRQFDAQNWFNTHAIQQKVQDAKAAGISPEFAMGAGTVSAPSMSAFSDSIGPALGRAGQNISRALVAGMDSEQKKLAEATVEGANLDNDLKRQQLRQLRSAGTKGPSDDTDKGPYGTQSQDAQHTPHQVVGGGKLKAAPWMSDAQSVENRHGELMENVQGVSNVVMDTVFTAGINGYLGPSIQKRFERADARARGGRPVGSFWDDVQAHEWAWIKRKLGL